MKPARYFEGKTVLITGAGSGIGKALSETIMTWSPAALVLGDIDTAAVQANADALGPPARATQVDVTSEDSVRRMIDGAVADFGRLDVIINNAGIAAGGELQDYAFEDWRRILDVNLWGVIYGTTLAYRHMLRQGYGHIVNVASLGGLIPEPMAAAYSASKHAVVGLTSSLREEAHARGIHVSVVCPGVIDTPIFDRATYVGNVDGAAVKEGTLGHGPMRPGEAAHVICNGIARNDGVILVNPSDRLFWGLYRASPRALSPLHRYLAKYFREHFETNANEGD